MGARPSGHLHWLGLTARFARGPQPTLLRVKRLISFHVRAAIRAAAEAVLSARRPTPLRWPTLAARRDDGACRTRIAAGVTANQGLEAGVFCLILRVFDCFACISEHPTIAFLPDRLKGRCPVGRPGAAIPGEGAVMPELPLVGDEFAGYRLRAVLGRGGMSVVYQAENPRLGSVIALKVLAPELATDDAFRARFLEESRIATSLNYPNVIPIHDMGSSEGLLYIAMRYVPGTDLRQMIRKRGRNPPVQRRLPDRPGRAGTGYRAPRRAGAPGCQARQPADRADQRDDPNHVYLADFGLTKHAMSRSGLTSTGQFLGTVNYVAPEQILGMSVLGSADQYSLGCVLYECLTGRVPFEKDLDAAIIWAHVEESPRGPRSCILTCRRPWMTCSPGCWPSSPVTVTGAAASSSRPLARPWAAWRPSRKLADSRKQCARLAA